MIKKYYACVALDMIRYFNEKLESLADKIHRVEVSEVRYSTIDNILCREYIIEAEEGVINPKHELEES